MIVPQGILVKKKSAPVRILYCLRTVLYNIENICAAVAGVFMLAAMLLIVIDTLMRYFFNAPFSFSYTLMEEYFLVIIFCLALPWSFRTGGYIRITGCVDLLPHGCRVFILRVGLLVSSLYTGALAWQGGKKFLNIYLTGEVKTGVIDWPLDLSWVWIPIGFSVLALRLFFTAIGPEGDLHHENEEVDSNNAEGDVT